VRVLVTGGAGYLGRELIGRAAARGWAVQATFHAQRTAAQAEWVRLDIRDDVAVGAAVAGIDCVIHTAYRQSEDTWSTNVDGSQVVARAAAAAGARLVHLSTDIVFDGARGGYCEEDTPQPVNDYGRSKAEAERVIAAAHPRALIARTSLLYGASEPGPQERLAATGTTFFADEIRSPAQVGDVADALLEVAELDLAGPLHLGGADDVSRYEFALLLGADSARISPAHTTPDRAPNVSLDSSRARSLLKTRLRGVREVLGHA
jgi:dTDP-4-dehydrorhamnose reductase